MVKTQPVNVTNARQARRIASLWHSPGTIGRHLATLASGIPVSGEDVVDDIDATIAHDKPFGIDRAELDALRFWAQVTDDPSVFTTYPMRECGCWPHRTRTTERTALWCEAEKQGYCNFECECDTEGGE